MNTKVTVDENELRTKCRWPRNPGILGDKMMDELGIYLAKLHLHTTITPNHLTITGLFSGLIGVGLLTFPNYLIVGIGYLLIFLFGVIDYTDGVIARYKNIASEKGKYYDDLGHFIPPLIFLAVGIHILNTTGNVTAVILGGFSSFMYVSIDFNAKLMNLITGEKKHQLYLTGTSPTRSAILKIQKNLTFGVHIIILFCIATFAEYFILKSSFYLLLFFAPFLTLTFFAQICFYSQKL